MNPDGPDNYSKEGLAQALAKLLGSTVVAQYMAHGFHWNVKGPEFTQFHEFFGEIYEDWSGTEDKVAEYIRTLGFDAPYSLQQFDMLSCIEAKPAAGEPIEMATYLYEANIMLLNCVEDIFNLATAINNQGIANFAAERMDAHSKLSWMLGTTIGADSMQIQTLDMGKSGAEVPLIAFDNDNDESIAELQPTPESIRHAMLAAGHLVPEEADLAQALVEIADKYGKFDEDSTGIWADYHEAKDNPYAEMGVKCGNCVLYRGGQECAIIAFAVEPEGYCRFAVLPDGSVDPSKAPTNEPYKHDHELRPGEFSGGAGAPAEVLDMSKIKKPKAKSLLADAEYGDECPPATQDIQLNLKNRQNAIDNVGYGPLNPKEPSTEFWQDKADKWKVTIDDAKKSVCGNCVFFDRRPKTLDCIETGLSEGGSGDQSAWDAIDQAELGYCTALDFKCAASRTCNAWAVGGPITEDAKEPVAATAGSKPAPKKDQIKGSDKNKKGSAATGRKITFSKAVENSLKEKVESHNKSVSADSKKVTLSMLKAVYRRGAGAFSTSHRPDQNRNSWAMGRVNAYLRLVKSGKPDNAKYTTDNDLLPDGHPKSTNSSKSLTASVFADRELYIELQDENLYEGPEEALVAMAEYSGLGYESIPVFRAAWRRGVLNNESPFDRAARLAIDLYDSEDADLLPKQEEKDQ